MAIIKSSKLKWISFAIAFAVLQVCLYKTYGQIRLYRAWTIPYETSKADASVENILPKVRIGFIGDSNTVRGNPSAPAMCARTIESLLSVSVEFVNAGRGSKSAEDWIPNGSEGHYLRAVSSFKQANIEFVVITLGTNGSESFEDSCREICAETKRLGFKPILNFPPYNPGGNDDERRRIEGVLQSIDKIIQDGLAIRGDTKFFDYMKRHPNQSTDGGIHPTQPALEAMGILWGIAIANSIQDHIR